MALKPWTATVYRGSDESSPVESSIVKMGNCYVLMCRLDREPDRPVEVLLAGNKRDLLEHFEEVRSWLMQDDTADPAPVLPCGCPVSVVADEGHQEGCTVF